MAALSGNCLKPLTFRSIALNYSYGKHPIVASGGLLTAQDIYYALALGASSAQLVTALLVEQQASLKYKMQKLAEIIKANGFKNISEVTGSLSSNVLQKKTIDNHIFRINQSACDNCGQCAFLCQYHAIEEESGNYLVNPHFCTGCGLCVSGCKEEAIKEVPSSAYIN